MIDLICDDFGYDNSCRYCSGEGHGKIVCDCGHKHDDHNFGAGCRIIVKKTEKGNEYCQCDRYSQKHLRDIKEPTAYYKKRTANLGITDGQNNI